LSEGRAVAIERMRHMLEAANAIIEYTTRGPDAFERDAALQDAIVYQVIVLGEASKAVLAADPTLETDLPEIEWSPIARMRDRLTHHYWATDRSVVWSTATIAVPAVRDALTAALKRLG
jgi:uncharacterized protein with HEPN domain